MLRSLSRRLDRLEQCDAEVDEMTLIERRMEARGSIWLYSVTEEPIPDALAAILDGDSPEQAYADEQRYRHHCRRTGIKPRHNVNGKIFRRHEEWVIEMSREDALAKKARNRQRAPSEC